MRPRSRVFLLVIAVVLALAIFGLGAMFTHGVESSARASGNEFVWFLIGTLVASPLWLPAVIPTRSRTVSLVIRWCSAGALLFPLRYAAAVVLQQFRVYPSAFFSLTVLAVSVLIALGCVAAIFVLLTTGTRGVRNRSA